MKFNDTDIGAAIQMLIQSYLAGNVHTAMPGQVKKYDATKRVADVKPLLKIADTNGNQLEIELIPDVPVAIYGTQNAGVVIPIAVDDYVLLIFSERSIGKFLSTGKISNTSFNHTFALSDAIALPGLFPIGSSIESTESTDITVYNNGGKVVLNASGDIELGNSTLKKLITEDVASVFNNHVHNFTAAPSGAFSTSTPANLTTGLPGTPVGNIPATFINAVGSSHMTTKAKAQ